MRTQAFEDIKKKMGESYLDSLLIVKQPNIRYLTGFTCDYGYLVINPSERSFFTSKIYKEGADSALHKTFTVTAVENNIYKTFATFNASFWGKRVGYEPDVVTCTVFNKLRETLPDVELVPVSNIIEDLRERKDSSEIQSITRAQCITEQVFTAVLDLVREGAEERDIASEIDYQIRKNGGEHSAFETIVASGPHSSRPHATPSRRKLEYGDVVLFDMGTIVNGYASDMTRMVVLGKADSEQKKIYNLVLDAQMAAIDTISSGKKCSEVYMRALNVFEKAGYAEKFIHSLGHGIGLEVHENPTLSPYFNAALKKDSVITVEPGIYIPGWAGIRIEDMVLVTDDGCVNLTNAPKNLLEL